MKFLKTEHQDLCKAIENKGHQVEEFSFVKKRGWLLVKKGDQVFKFHRKESNFLNENLQWEDRLSYRYESDSKQVETKNWIKVLKAFTKWLQ